MQTEKNNYTTYSVITQPIGEKRSLDNHHMIENNSYIKSFIIQQFKKDFLIFSQEEYFEKYHVITNLAKILHIKYKIEEKISLIVIKKLFAQLEREMLLKEKLELDLLQLEVANIATTLSFLQKKYKHANQLLLEKLFYDIMSQKLH